MDLTVVVLFVVWPLLLGASFAGVTALLRRRHGPWALLACALVPTILAVTAAVRLGLDGVLFARPVIPAILVSAGVLEWLARRAPASALSHHVAWGTLAFLIPAAIGLIATLSR